MKHKQKTSVILDIVPSNSVRTKSRISCTGFFVNFTVHKIFSGGGPFSSFFGKILYLHRNNRGCSKTITCLGRFNVFLKIKSEVWSFLPQALTELN